MNHDTRLRYVGLSEMVAKAASGSQATLLTMWGDRVRIQSPGYDRFLLQALQMSSSPLAVLKIDEGDKTWGWAYSFFSGSLHNTVSVLVSTSPDGFMRYIAECTGIDSYVKEVVIDRLLATDEWTHVTPRQTYEAAQDMFRLNATVKGLLLQAIALVMESPLYNHSLLDKRREEINASWLGDKFIHHGPLMAQEWQPHSTQESLT